jgi:hypothetical protein
MSVYLLLFEIREVVRSVPGQPFQPDYVFHRTFFLNAPSAKAAVEAAATMKLAISDRNDARESATQRNAMHKGNSLLYTLLSISPLAIRPDDMDLLDETGMSNFDRWLEQVQGDIDYYNNAA